MLFRGQGDGIAAFARNHPDAVASHRDTWFVLAVERWLRNDTDGANHWLDLITARSAVEPPQDLSVEHAVVRLLRARFGVRVPGPRHRPRSSGGPRAPAPSRSRSHSCRCS